MHRHFESLESRSLLSAGGNTDLFGSSSEDILVAAAAVAHSHAARAAETFVATTAVPSVGGTYRGATSKVTLNDIPVAGTMADLPSFRTIALTISVGRRRVYGDLNFAPGTVGTSGILLTGKLTGNTFTLRGSYADGAEIGIVLVTTTIKVSCEASADGRRITGRFSVTQEKLAGTEVYGGRFNIKRAHG